MKGPLLTEQELLKAFFGDTSSDLDVAAELIKLVDKVNELTTAHNTLTQVVGEVVALFATHVDREPLDLQWEIQHRLDEKAGK